MPAVHELNVWDEPGSLEIPLRRLINLRDSGWFQGHRHARNPLIEMPILVLAGDLNVVFPMNEGLPICTPDTVLSLRDRSWIFASVCHSSECITAKANYEEIPGRAGPPIGGSAFFAPRNGRFSGPIKSRRPLFSR